MEVSAERAENKQSRGHQLLCLGTDSGLLLSSSAEQTPVRHTTLSAESPFHRTDVNKDQMVLMDNIHFRDWLECACSPLLLQADSSLWFARLFSYKPPNLLCFWSRLLFLTSYQAPLVLLSFLVARWHTPFTHVCQWRWPSTNSV